MTPSPLNDNAGPTDAVGTVVAIRSALPEELRGQFQDELDEATDQALEQNDRAPIYRVKARWLARSQTPSEA
jgi:hypothetical protein